MTITIYSLACDGPKCGTVGGAFVTEAEAYGALLAQLNLTEDDAANALIAAEDFDALEELLSESTDGLTTWTIDRHELQYPHACSNS